ncbi:MAG: S8 family serine peptidase, partial [Campylobacterota bacterium]|nr:S8 family serine peptidase [Campylobacterota bacterium]
NVEIQNHSWGDGFDTDYTTRDRDFDNYIIDNNDVIFKSAGNTNLGINVTSPGKGLNVITVGNYDDATDTIFFQSSFGDPQTKNQKPEIVAPGTTIDTDLDGTIDNSGTSFSAPHAGAFAANLMSNYTWMQDKPHLMKAVMLAGATKSISGGADAVGVGGIDFWSAAYNSHMMWWTNASYATNAANDWGTNNNYLEWKVSLTAGNNYRAVISWLNDGDYTYAHRTDSHPIGKDFDLSVWDPNGTWKCGSGSFYNPYEMCQFSTTISGDYTIRIIQYMDRDTSSNMSLAAVVNKY